ncbi:MAG: energy-coupling factor transporter transmembrane component T [Christensenellales bacterium]|nr:energy-coupling factor transporter transmembrane component T [Christensenellales bacterium]
MYIEQIQIQRKNKIAAAEPMSKLVVLVLFLLTNSFLMDIVEPFNGYPLLALLWFFVAFALAVLSEITRKFLKALNVILTIVVFLLVTQSLISSGVNPTDPRVALWSIKITSSFSIHIWEYGFRYGVILALGILNFSSILIWFFTSTEDKALTRSLESHGMHYKFAYTFLASFRMIDVFNSKMRHILSSQQARGVETQGNLLLRIKAFMPIMLPLVLSAITDIEERVQTLECKGFNIRCKKTHLLQLRKSGAEIPLISVFSLFLVLSLVGRFFL